MAEEVILTPEERIRDLAGNLVRGMMGSDATSISNRRYLFSQLKPQVFKDEHYIIITVFYAFKDRNITPDEEFMKMHLMRNLKLFNNSKEYIDLTAYADLAEDPVEGYIAAVLKEFVRLRGIEDTIYPDEYNLLIEKYKDEYCNFEIGKALSQAKMILYDGVQIGSKFFQGYLDAVAYVKKREAVIDSMLDQTKGAGFIDSRADGVRDTDEKEAEKIGDFGLIHELNHHLGGIWTPLFYNIMGATKGGKSKFMTALIHNIMVEYGVNVSVWAVEGGYKMFWAQLRACHYEWLYNRNKDQSERVASLSQRDIMFKNYPSEEIRALEEASRIDLFTNPNYGVANMIDRPFRLETFIDDVETSVQLNNSKMIAFDYLQMIVSDVYGKSDTQAVSTAYQLVLSYIKSRNIAAMSPAQFTQEFMDAMANSKDSGGKETRIAGAKSSEVVRTPDINIALYASIEDLQRGVMDILSIPSRMCEPFPVVHLNTDLRGCVFASAEPED